MYKYLILIGFILVYFLYKYQKVEHYINLVDNGSFKKGEFSKNNSGTNHGNTSVKLINPGESSYVLEQNTHSQGYKINATVQPNTSYKIGVWVSYKLWNGNKNNFHISFSNKCGKNTTLNDSGKIVMTKKINNTTWYYRTFIFTVPNNSDGRLELYIGYIPTASKGLRYYTDIKLEKYYELINNLPNKDELILFLSGFHEESLKDSSLVWKDISMNGNDLHFTSPLTKESNFLILENEATLSPSDKIIPNNKNFVFIWSGKMGEFSIGDLIEVFSNNKYGMGIKISYKTTIGVNNKLIISIGKEIIEYTPDRALAYQSARCCGW